MKVIQLKKNPFNGELSESADLQEAYNKLCKVTANDAMSVDLGLKKIAILEQEKKKVKDLELELSIAREQSNRFASSKFDHIQRIQKPPLDKSGLAFVHSISKSETHSINFVPSSEPSKIEVVKPKEEAIAPKKIRVDLIESKPKSPNFPKGKKHDRPLWVCHFCGKVGHTHPNYFKLQAAKRATKKKVLVRLKHKILWYLLMNW